MHTRLFIYHSTIEEACYFAHKIWIKQLQVQNVKHTSNYFKLRKLNNSYYYSNCSRQVKGDTQFSSNLIFYSMFSSKRQDDKNNTTDSKKATDPKAENTANKLGNDDKTLSDGKSTVLKIKEAVSKAISGKKLTGSELSSRSMDRNFITPVRAMSDFLLKPSDLEGLRRTLRRSPYENKPPMVVLSRREVELRAIEIWGSKENLLKEKSRRQSERENFSRIIMYVKQRVREHRRKEQEEISADKSEQRDSGLLGSSGQVVLAAVFINGSNFLFKLLAWLYTGSHSMFSESIHSLADTINQLILAFGIHKSVQKADSDHPYGYSNMRYVSSLISGVGIFCVGTGLSIYHGITGLLNPAPLESFFWAFIVLGGSLVSEGATLALAINSIRRRARAHNMPFWEFVLLGQDPSVNVVLFEDIAAVLGVGVAAACMGLSTYYNTPVPDAIGSLLVGGILGGVASFIIMTNAAALVGRSIPYERLEKINSELEADVMIRAIHDVKGIDIGNFLVRYKAEVDFDGRELTRRYLHGQDLSLLLEEIKTIQNVDQLEEFILKHGENIVDMLGGEIDRIETELRKKHPEVRHCDLEIL